MKTLKKSLCLVLALVFVLGLCTFGAGAAVFTDADEINYEDAVTVMQGLGILVGYPDGSFQPAKTVTRAEAAKMIAYMMLGEKYAEKLAAGSAFDDVPETHWAAKYVNFCASKGIIVGYGNGNYGPSDPVTGIQMAKMLLVATGYGEMGEFTGSNWDVNAFTDAVEVGIFDDAETEDFEAPATREETALYVFNTLVAVDQMKWDVDQNKYQYYKAPFGETVWNLDVMKGIVIANQATGEDYTVVEYEYFNNGTAYTSTVNFAVETGLDLIGHQVEMYYDYTEKKDADKIYYYDSYLADDISTTIAIAGAQSIGALAKQVGFVDTDFNDVAYYLNYIKTEDSLWDACVAGGTAGYWSAPSFAKTTNVQDLTKNLGMVAIKNANGSSDSDSRYISASTLVLDEDGVIISALKDSYAVAKVSALDDEIVTVIYDDGTTDDIAIENCYEGIAKDDYVTVITIGTILSAQPTTTTTVEVNKVDASWSFIGWYFFYGTPGMATCTHSCPSTSFVEDDEGETVAMGDIVAGNTVKFYVDSKGSAFAAVLVDSSVSSYIFVTKVYSAVSLSYGDYTYSKMVQGVDAEGNEVNLKIDEAGPYAAATTPTYTVADPDLQSLYKVKTLSTGISKLDNAATAGVADITIDDDAIDYYDGKEARIDGTRLYLNENTTYIYINKNGAKLEISLGECLKLTDEATAAAYCFTPGKATETVPAVWVYGMDAPATEASNFIYVAGADWSSFGIGDPYKVLCDCTSPADLSQYMMPTTKSGTVTIDGDMYEYYNLYIDGVSTSGMVINPDNLDISAMYGIFNMNTGLLVGFYTYSVDADGIYTVSKVAAGKSEAIVVSDKDAIYKGKLLVTGTAMDDVDLADFTIVDLSAGYKDAKGYSHAIDSADAMTAALSNGYRFAMTYMLDSDGEPTGALYVTLSGYFAD